MVIEVDAQVGSDLYLAISEDVAGVDSQDGTEANWTLMSGIASGLATAGIEDSSSSRQVPGQSKTVTRQSTGRHDWSGSLEVDRNPKGIKHFGSLKPASTKHFIIGFRGAGLAALRGYRFKAKTSKNLTIDAENVQVFAVTPAVDGDMIIGTILKAAGDEKAAFTAI